MRVGYSFWGFMADVRVSGGQVVSSPDGNAFYSWALVNALIDRGHQVFRMQLDRDAEYVNRKGINAFNAFSSKERLLAYLSMYKAGRVGDDWVLPELDLLILEWRWPIPGRNTEDARGVEGFTPDLDTQMRLLEHYGSTNTRIVVLDLDYKLAPEDESRWPIDFVLELGMKRGEAHRFMLPINYKALTQFEVESAKPRVVYVGNRYERDEQVDRYLDASSRDVDIEVYGNWLEGGRDSAQRWHGISFFPRVGIGEFREIYRNAAVTPLLAKPEYCENGFMTARLYEALLFGTLPLFVSEFSYQDLYCFSPHVVTIAHSNDLLEVARYATSDPFFRKEMIKKWREYLATCVYEDRLVQKLESIANSVRV